MESEGQSMDPRVLGIAENIDVLLEALDVNPVLLTELSAHEILDEFTKQRITSAKKYDSGSVYKSFPMESEGQSMDPRIRGIAENRDVLLEALDVNPVLLTELSGHGILDECTRQRITSEKKYDINKRFIDWLETESSQTIDVVLQKLRDDKQDHVANLIDGTEGERPLSAKVKLRIRKLSGWLTKNMTTDHGLIDELLARGAISSRDCEDIKGKPTESERAMQLIYVILRRSDRTMKIFQEALVASNQAHVAQVVEKDEMIELSLRQTCKTVDPDLSRSPRTDKDEEMQRKLKSISSRNFALAVVKATNDVTIYVLCEDCDERRLLEELFDNSEHRAVLLEELIKLSTSDTRARNPLEFEVLQLIHDILPTVGHSGIVLQSGANCGPKRELERISDSRSSNIEKNSLETDNMTPQQSLISSEKSHVISSEEIVCDLDSRSHKENEESLNEKIDLDRKMDLCKIEGTKATNKTENRKIDDNVRKRKSNAEHKKLKNQVGLTVDDDAKESSGPGIQELQLKLKLVGKQRDRETSEIIQLRKSLRQLQEEKDEISKDLNVILELNRPTEDIDRVLIELKQREREFEKENKKLRKALTEAMSALQQTKGEHGDLKEENCKHNHYLQNSSLLDIMKEIKIRTNEGLGFLGLKSCIELATGGILNGKFVLSLCSLILHNTKSIEEAAIVMHAAFFFILVLPLSLHLPLGIPDVISSFCFTNISVFFWIGIVVFLISIFILGRPIFWAVGLPILSVLILQYLESDGFGPGMGVGRYCQEDKCVYMFCWEYLSNNMRIEGEVVEEIPAQNFNGAGGLFKSPAAFAVWNKYTSHRWDKEMREYTQDGRFIRKIYTKPLLGTAPFHFLTVFRLSSGLISAGYGSLYYGDPMLKVCLLDTNGNIIKSFGGQYGPSKGVPMVLDADREGCVIVADQKSGKMMALCSDKEHMKQLRDKVHEGNSPFEMCLHSQMFDCIIEATKSK